MFVLVDPSERQTEKEKWLEQSLIRSHASSRAHRHKRRLVKQNEGCQDSGKLNQSDSHVSVNLSLKIDTSTSASRSTNYQHGISRKRESQSPAQNSGDEKRRRTSTSEDSVSQNRSELATFTIAISLIESNEEGRSLQFFHEKTALEWLVWHDADFWQVLAFQAAVNNPSVKHALASLGALHESLSALAIEEKIRSRLISMNQCGKALACLVRDYDRMSISAILTTYAAVATFTVFTNSSCYLQAMQAQFDIIDNLKQFPDQTNLTDRKYVMRYLEPSIERQRSETGQYVDLLWCLRATSATLFYEPIPINIPTQFASLQDARAALNRVLNFVTYEVKSKGNLLVQIPASAKKCFNLWLDSLHQFELQSRAKNLVLPNLTSNGPDDHSHIKSYSSRRELLTISLLRISAKIGMLMIETMNCDSEHVFDNYLPQYQELAAVFETVLDFHADKVAACSLQTSSSLLCLIGNAASRWCRDPTTRRHLISLLYRAQSHDSHEGAIVWAEYCRCTMQFEEKGLSVPPIRAADIPTRNRVRIHSATFFHNCSVRQVRYHVWPYRVQDFRDFYIPRLGSGEYQEECPDSVSKETKPFVVVGRGYMSWMGQVGSDKCYTVRNPRFYFPLPRI